MVNSRKVLFVCLIFLLLGLFLTGCSFFRLRQIKAGDEGINHGNEPEQPSNDDNGEQSVYPR